MSPPRPGFPACSAALRWCEVAGPRLDTLQLYERLRVEACPWILDSACMDGRLGRFSFVGADPWLVIRVRGERVEVHCRREAVPDLAPGFQVSTGDPFEALRRWLPSLPEHDRDAPPELPFVGGAVGHLGYELGAFTVPVEMGAAEGLGFPDATLVFVDRLVAVDHASGRSYAIGWGFGRDPDEAASQAQAALEACQGWIGRLGVGPGVRRSERPPPADDAARRRALLATGLPPDATCSIDRSGYEERVAQTIREIEAGNVYEVNLTRRISLPFDGDPFVLYRALRRESPAPFACLMELPEGAILSSSPERFVRLDRERRVESRPIKGTRPRGATGEADTALRCALACSEKDRAENLMIVDLVRNDLGRVCEVGSVRVPELMAVEVHPSVFHLVSTVTGRLRADCDAVDLIRAAFPPGSMTGAPKIAAMRLIERLEPVRRGVYSGAIGYFDARGGFDLSVVIRTLLVEKGSVHIHAGGAIVADSSPAGEIEETLDKARAGLAAWRLVTGA